MSSELNHRSFLKKSSLLLCSGSGFNLLPSFSPSGECEKEAMFFKKRENKFIQCELCFRQCLIPDGKRGFCRVRENQGGELRSLLYGRPGGLQIDPIELEPMYHMVPGHKNLCVYTASCNFRCKHCHNWPIHPILRLQPLK